MIDNWRPSRETLRVLQQFGYSDAALNDALVFFRGLVKDYPSVISLTDKCFCSWLADRSRGETDALLKRHGTKVQWRPTQKEWQYLLDEGFSEDYLTHRLDVFRLKEAVRDGITFSPFLRFLKFIKR